MDFSCSEGEHRSWLGPGRYIPGKVTSKDLSESAAVSDFV